jgi:hypothetical protein
MYSAFVGNHMDVQAKMHGMQNIKIKIVLYIWRKLLCYSDIQRSVAFNDRHRLPGGQNKPRVILM